MNPKEPDNTQLMTWKKSLRSCISKPTQLKLNDPGLNRFSEAAHAQFPLRVPTVYFNQIDTHNKDDPLLRQILPHPLEEQVIKGFVNDPLQEQKQRSAPGILHKYHGRILLLITGACAIHCRYCFRRHYPYAESNPLRDRWPLTLKHISNQTDVHEIILSGGDPLTLTNDQLLLLINDLDSIPHVRRLRIHTRIPVVLPDRIDEALIKLLRNCGMKVVIVIHVNHPNELGSNAESAIGRLHAANILLLNQSVLLAKVNDDVETLANLSEALSDNGVLPYYLHLLDPVAGTAHFSVSEADAKQLHEKLRQKLPGYLVPRLVREINGLPYKKIIG